MFEKEIYEILNVTNFEILKILFKWWRREEANNNNIR